MLPGEKASLQVLACEKLGLKIRFGSFPSNGGKKTNTEIHKQAVLRARVLHDFIEP